MTRQEYIKQVAGHLMCSSARKREIAKQLNSHIGIALEEGRSLEDILAEMGKPEVLAEEFNDNFDEREKRKARGHRRAAIIGLAVLLVLAVGAGFAYWMLPKERDIYKSRVFDTDTIQERTEEVILAFGRSDYETFDTYLSPEVREAMKEITPEMIKQYVGDDWGAFRSMGNLYMAEVSQQGRSYAIVQVNTSYDNVNVVYTLTYNENMELYGIYVK